MALCLPIHLKNPEPRKIKQVVAALGRGELVVIPTDSGYSICCAYDQKSSVEKIRRLCKLKPDHYFTLFCPSLSALTQFVKVDNTAFRYIKKHSPAPITYILPATREAPKYILNPKEKTVGVRISCNPIFSAIVSDFDKALAGCSVPVPPDSWPLIMPEEILLTEMHMISIVIDAGPQVAEHASIVDLTCQPPVLLRQGVVAKVDLDF